MLEKELNYFILNQDHLVDQYDNKILVIIGEKVVDVYDNLIEAYTQSKTKYDLGSFMIQSCKSGSEAHTLTISHI